MFVCSINGEIVMACGAVANIVKSSLGPVGLDKVLLLPSLLLLMFFADSVVAILLLLARFLFLYIFMVHFIFWVCWKNVF